MNSNGVWKWIAALLLTVMLAGSPAIWLAITAPTATEVDLIRERQQLVLQQIPVLNSEISALRERIVNLEFDVSTLRDRLDNSVRPR